MKTFFPGEDLLNSENVVTKLHHISRQLEHIMANTKVNRERFVVSQGVSKIPLPTAGIAAVYSKMKMNFLVDFSGNRYKLDITLTEFESLVDRRRFFRVSRGMIINIDAISEFRTIQYSKIALSIVENKYITNPVVISQVTAPLFRSWINSL